MRGRQSKSEAVLSVFLVIVGGCLLAVAFTIKQPEEGTRIMPIVYSSVILVGGAIGAARALFRREPTESSGAPVTESREPGESPGQDAVGSPLSRLPKPAQVALVIIGYLVLLDFVGYVVATALFGVVLLKVIGRRVTLRLAAFPVVMSLALYVIFEYGLSVRLP